MRERIPHTTDYPDEQLVKMLVRHVVTLNNLQAEKANPATDRVGGRQPHVRVAPQGPAQAERFARLAMEELPDILDAEFVIVGLARSRATRTRVTAEITRDTWDLDMPIRVDNRLAELHKGWPYLGGDQQRLRTRVEDNDRLERQTRDGWRFRHGRPLANRFGAYHLSQAETDYQAGARIRDWAHTKPAVPENIAESGQLLLDVGFGHGMSIARGVALAIHGDNPDITVAEAHRLYHLPNASSLLLGYDDMGHIHELGRILPDHTQQ
jgi:hypothetical protein